MNIPDHYKPLLGQALKFQSNAEEARYNAALQALRPFMLLRPKVYPDGDQWCALYGDNVQEGVAGFGDTPEKASIQFDIEWKNRKAMG